MFPFSNSLIHTASYLDKLCVCVFVCVFVQLCVCFHCPCCYESTNFPIQVLKMI